MFLPEKNRMFFWFEAALFRFVARFARVRIEESSGNRFSSTAYFAKPGIVGGECSGGKQPGLNLPDGIFWWGIFRSPIYLHTTHTAQRRHTRCIASRPTIGSCCRFSSMCTRYRHICILNHSNNIYFDKTMFQVSK